MSEIRVYVGVHQHAVFLAVYWLTDHVYVNTTTEGSYEDLNVARIFPLMSVVHIAQCIDCILTDWWVVFSLRAHKIVSYLSYKTTQVGFKMCFLHFCKLLGSKIKPGVKAGPSTKGLTICHKVSMATGTGTVLGSTGVKRLVDTPLVIN